MDDKPTVTVWFGREIDIDTVRNEVHKLANSGYIVRPTFYIGYNVNTAMVYNYLCYSLDISDYLYIIGEEGSLLQDILSYAKEKGKQVIYNTNICALQGV